MRKALVVFSGGQDSTICLWWAKRRFDEVRTVTFNYRQANASELTAASKLLTLAGIPSENSEYIFVGNLLQSSSPLIDHGATIQRFQTIDEMREAVKGEDRNPIFVPGRNILFLTLAANRAFRLGADTIVVGSCISDTSPDCGADFLRAMEKALQLGLRLDVNIAAPLLHLTKAEGIALAIELGCYDALAYTVTAYDGAYPPGNDRASLVRAKGFEEAGTPDPLIVRAWHEGLIPLPDSPNYDSLRPINMLW